MNITLTDNNDKILHTAGKYCTEDITLINKVQSLDTSDATASAEDIVKNKTAYVNGKKITGTFSFSSAASSIVYGDNIEVIDDLTLRFKTTFNKNEGFAKGSTFSLQADIDSLRTKIGLTPEKIAMGNTILGVEGTAESGVELDYSLLSGNNYTIKFAENPIEFLTASKNVFDLIEGATISTTGHYEGGGSPDAAIGNYFRKETNEVVRHKDVNNVMTYYAYFSDETLPFATALIDKSAYTTPGYYTIDYTTMSIKERVGSTLTLNFTYEMNSIRSMYKIVNGSRQWIDINSNNEEQWKENFKDLIEAIYPYEETIEVKELKAKIAELEAEMAEANTIIDQLNGEEV